MYLILDKEKADERNRFEAFKRNAFWKNAKAWSEVYLEDGSIALDVGDGDGLTDEEKAQCVNELPNIINE